MYFKDFASQQAFFSDKKFCISVRQHQHKQNAEVLMDDKWQWTQSVDRECTLLLPSELICLRLEKETY